MFKTRRTYTGPYLIWRYTRIYIWKSVKHPYWIVNCLQPVLWVGILWLVCYQREHVGNNVGMCPLCNCFDVAFCNTILVLCSNTTKRVTLLLLCTMFFEISRSKHTNVGVIFLYVEKPLFSAIASKWSVLLIVSGAVFEYCEYWRRLNNLLLAWSANKLPQV